MRAMTVLPRHPSKSPKRKFRGKRRYFRAVRSEAEGFVLPIGTSAWWDFWHYHSDWDGWGNASWRYRSAHLEALTIVFRKILEASPRIAVPFQTWCSIDT